MALRSAVAGEGGLPFAAVSGPSVALVLPFEWYPGDPCEKM